MSWWQIIFVILAIPALIALVAVIVDRLDLSAGSPLDESLREISEHEIKEKK